MSSTQNQPQASKNNISHDVRSAAFANALLDPDVEIPDGIGKRGEITPKRFSVYRNNVVVSLMEAMKANFSSLHAIMGEENFAKIARNFIFIHPPTSPMMQNFGAQFPGFLASFKPLEKSPFLVDIAQAEHAWLASHHASDAEPLKPEELASVDPDQTGMIKFNPHPATHLLQSEYPLFDFFNARFNWDGKVDLSQSQSVLLTRPALDVAVTKLNSAQASFIGALITQSPLGEAIGNAIEIDEDFDPSAAIALILETGAFKSITISN